MTSDYKEDKTQQVIKNILLRPCKKLSDLHLIKFHTSNK